MPLADPLRHRQTKGAATAMVDLTPPRHIPTLPEASLCRNRRAAIPAVRAGGGRILARSLPAKIYEAGMDERLTPIEFDSPTGQSPPRERVPPIRAIADCAISSGVCGLPKRRLVLLVVEAAVQFAIASQV